MATSPTLPAGTKAYGSTTYLDTDEMIWVGTGPLQFRSLYPALKIDELLAEKANVSGQVFTGNISAPNLSGVNTGDQDLTPYQLLSQKGQANGYTPLDSGAKVPTVNLPDSIVGAVKYQGTYNVATNTPTLPSASASLGFYYIVNTAGTYSGVDYKVGDWIISNGITWDKVDNSDAVTTVFGRLGNILANESDYASFYPLKNGTGATGIWGVDITGNSGTTTAMTVFGASSTILATNLGSLAVRLNATDSKVVDITGNAETVTNGVYTTGSYANPSWLTSLAYSKLTGAPNLGLYELLANKQNSLATDGTGVKYPTVDAVNNGMSELGLQKVTDQGNTSTNLLKIIGSSNTPELDGLELFYDETGNAVIQNYKRVLEEFGPMFYGGSKHVFDGGNSGFGTSMPTEKIDVIGKVLISEAPTVDNGATRLVDVVNNIPSTYPTISFSDSPIESQLSIFVEKYLTRNSDVTIVQIGDSISTNLNFASPVSDQKNRPPLITEKNINYFLENKLRWKEQSYFRFDNEELFFNNAGGGTIEDISVDDTAWGATGNAYYLPLTRVMDGGTNAGISYLFPSGMRRCDLIIHTDRLWADTTEIEISGGDGRVEVFDYASETWVEANNYTFSAKEPDTLVSLGFYRDQYQKRIKMRSLVDLGDKGITVKNIGAGRFGYWGIEMSPREFMFTYICASKGSHNIFMLRRYEEWMVDAFNPDLILQQTCIINEQAQTGVNPTYPAVISPEDFSQNFANYYDGLIAKGYTVFPYTLFAGLQAGIVHEDTGEWGVGTFENKALTIVDYTDALHNMYNEKKAPHVNFFNDFLKIAYSKTEIDGIDNIFTSAIEGSGVDGDTFTIDGIHFNDYGESLGWRLLEPFFNFKGKVNNISDLESVLLAGNVATTAIDLAVNMGVNLNSEWALKYDMAVGGVNLVKYGFLDGIIFADNETTNVGIHNTNPTEALDVVGKIKASEAPTNPTDVVRLTDLSNYVNTTADQFNIAGNKTWAGDQLTSSGKGFYTFDGSGGSSSLWYAGFQSINGNKEANLSYLTGLSINTSGTATASAIFKSDNLTGARTLQAPDASGTLALTSQFESGTYTPTVTGASNVSSASNNGLAHYKRIGNEVTVFGSCQITPTAGISAGTNTSIIISLPIASDIAAGQDLVGHGSALYNNSGNNVAYSSNLVGSAADDAAGLSVIAYTTNTISITYSYMYTIK